MKSENFETEIKSKKIFTFGAADFFIEHQYRLLFLIYNWCQEGFSFQCFLYIISRIPQGWIIYFTIFRTMFTLLLWLMSLSTAVHAVVSPLDRVEQELQEMVKALGEGSKLKAEFEKFMKEQLTGGTGPRRFRPTGTLNRSKLRGLISRTKLRKQLQQQVGLSTLLCKGIMCILLM